MKDFIKVKIRENLSELLTKNKPEFGGGVEHKVYSSPNNPNVLYKVGDKATVDKWLQVFKSNPKLFPKVYRTGILKNGKSYVEIEKLNTQGVLQDWQFLEQELEMIGVIDTDVFEDNLDNEFIGQVVGYDNANAVLGKLSYNKKAQELFVKWVTFLKTTFKYIKKFGYKGLDIHRYNFAYDAAGNIKAIDI